jgi:hypothetical protein
LRFGIGSHGDGATEEKALAGFQFSLVEGYDDDDGLCAGETARDAFPLEGKLRREQEMPMQVDLLEQGRFCSVICVYPFSQVARGHKFFLRTVACFESSGPGLILFHRWCTFFFSRGTDSLSLKLYMIITSGLMYGVSED